MQNIIIQQLLQHIRYQNAAAPTQDEISRRRRFLTRFPAQEANILSYQDNPGCKCGGDIQTALQTDSEGIDAVASFLLDIPTHIIMPVNAVGTVVSIQDSEPAWAALCARMQIEMFMYRGLTILKADGELKVYFY